MSADRWSGADVRIVRDFDEFLGLRGPWNELFDASATRSATLRFEWLTQWWRVYGPIYGAGGLNVITVWNAGQLIGALPLYRRVEGRLLRHARLQFISTGEAESEETCPEYMDLLVRPGEEARVVAAVLSALWGGAIARWDDLLLLDLAEQSSPLLARVQAMDHRSTIETIPRGVCLAADLSGGFEAYLSRLSPNSRQQARRTMRAADRAGASLELITAPGEIDAAFDDMVRLHQARWAAAGKPGCFSAPRFAEFHRALASALIPEGSAVLARLRVGEEVLAVIYGFVTQGKFDFYQSGVRLDGRAGVNRPGIVAHLWLMSRLAGQGVASYNFLRGAADYKQRLATGEQPMASLRVVRPTVRSALREAVMGARRLATGAFTEVARVARRFRGASLVVLGGSVVGAVC